MNEKEVRTPNEKSFSLTKVKLIKDGGVDVHYDVTESAGDEVYINKYHIECTKDPHPDLNNCFKALRPIMARLYNLTSYKTLLETEEFGASKKQKQLADDFANEAMGNIEMRGVSFSGSGDNQGVVLTGLFEFSNGQKAAINSPRLKFECESFGFEEELENICRQIEVEVYAYLFKGKKAQLELFGADGEPANN